MNRLLLLRHGENKANLTKEFSCRRVDYPLNAKGRKQAQQAGIALLDENIQAIFSSPLKRAAETAAIVGKTLNKTPILYEAFREIDVGKLEEARPSKESWAFHHQIIQSWSQGKVEIAFPEGENYPQVCERVLIGLRNACRLFPDQTILIVGHGGIFTFIIPQLCSEISLNDMLVTENHNGSISEIRVHWEGDQLQGSLLSWSNTDHLSGWAADLVSGLPNENELP